MNKRKINWITELVYILANNICKVRYYFAGYLISGLFFLIISTSIILNPIMGQDLDLPEQEDQAENQSNGNDAKNKELEKLLEYITLLEKYGPKSFEKEFIKSDFEEKLLKGIRDSLVKVSNHMQSSFDTLEYYHTLASNEFLQRNPSYYRLDFGFEIGLFDELQKIVRVRYNHFFERNTKYLYQIADIINENNELLIQAFGEDAIYPLIFKAKYLLGNILLYKGNNAYLLESLEIFSYVLGRNPYNKDFSPSDEFRNHLFAIIISIYDRLIRFTYDYNTDYLKMKFYARKKLSYLWRIVDINHDDQAIKNLKFRHLYTVYGPIMDPESENYKNLYSQYRKDTDVYPIIIESEEETESNSDENDQVENNSEQNDTTEDTPPSEDTSTDNTPDNSENNPNTE